MRVNLLGEQQSIYSIDWPKIIIIVILIIALLVLASHYLLLKNRYDLSKIEAEQYQQQLQILAEKKQQYQLLSKRVNTLEEYKTAVAQADYYWDDVVLELGYLTPERVRLINVEVDNRLMILQGIGEDNQRILALMSNLIASRYFTEAKIIKLVQQEELSFVIEAVIKEQWDL